MVGSSLIYVELMTITLTVRHRQRNLLVHNVAFMAIIPTFSKATHCRRQKADGFWRGKARAREEKQTEGMKGLLGVCEDNAQYNFGSNS